MKLPIWDIFLSHAEPDRATAEKLYELLSPFCVLFLANRSIEPGDDWDARIVEALLRSSITAPLISSNTPLAVGQREEIVTALDLARRDPRKRRVVPILLRSAEALADVIPFGLRMKHHLALSSDCTVSDVARNLRRILTELVPDKPGSSEERPAIPEIDRVSSLAQFASNHEGEHAPTPLRLLSDPKTWGFELSLEDKPWGRRWRIMRRREGSLVLALDFYQGYCVAYWPTSAKLAETIDAIEECLRLPAALPLRVTATRIDGLKYFDLLQFHELRRSLTEIGDLSFLRIDFGEQAFVAEIFSPDSNLLLKTGLILTKPSAATIAALTGRLGLEQSLPRAILESQVHRAIECHWRSRDDECG